MTVLLGILHMPTNVNAATIMRVKDARHEPQHHSSGSIKSDSDDTSNDSDYSDYSDNNSNSVDDLLQITIQNADDINWKRTHKNKRHTREIFLHHHQEESENNLEWINPCNGEFKFIDASNSFPVSHYLRQLRTVVGREFKTINDTMEAININNMSIWRKHRPNYSFMPKIKLNSNIALKRWYRQMQIYVATFAYLGRTQYKFDRTKHGHLTEITYELNDLLLSARSVLCEIETTINGSYPFPKNQAKLATIASREQMNARLNLTTKTLTTSVIEPVMLDLKFAKFNYYHYLRRMWRVMNIKIKNGSQRKYLFSDSNDSSLSATNEDIIGIDSSISGSKHQSSSASESHEFSFEIHVNNPSTPKRSRHQRKQRKNLSKSAELPTF